MDPLSISPANRKNNTDICVYIDRLIDMLILFGKLIIICNCTEFKLNKGPGSASMSNTRVKLYILTLTNDKFSNRTAIRDDKLIKS